MRTLACFFSSAALLVAGCGTVTSDPCKGVTGTCVALTVQSSTVTAVDSLHILASGALTGDQTSSGARSNLPIVVALKLPGGVAGELDLHVDGVLTATIVGSCDTSATVTDGQHTTAVCTLVGGDNGIDMSMGGGPDLTGTGPDMLPPPCDPKGVTGAQCIWRWQTPLPEGDAVLSIVAFDDANTFMLNSDGYIFYRDATKWSMLTAKPTVTGFFSIDTLFGGGAGMDLYAGGSINTPAPLAFHSTDHGATWTQETLPVAAMGGVGQGGSTGKAAILPSSTTGNIYQRDAASGAWTTRTANGAAGVTFSATAMNVNGAVVVGSGSSSTSAISYSTNDGVGWTVVATASITPSTQSLSGVCVGATGGVNSYWAIGTNFSASPANGVILHGAGNAPATWTQQGAAVTAGKQLHGCVATDATHAWAYGADVVLVTTDGINWASVTAPGSANDSFQAGAHGSGTALVIGGSTDTGYPGVLYRSTNAGTSFTSEISGAPISQLDTIYGVAPGVVYAAGANGAIYKTSDDTTWTKLTTTGSTAQLLGVWGASATDVYAVGSGGTIVHSTDGTTFTKYAGANAPPATTTLQDVWGSPTFGVYAVGFDGTSSPTRVAYRTTDHGVTWAPLVISGFTGVAGELFTAFSLGGDVWVAGDGGNVYHSTDGAAFTQQTTGSTIPITRLRGVTGQMIALLGTDPGTYISTVNNGVTWTMPTNSPLNDSPQNVAFVPDESAVYVFGSFAGPIVSFDKFATWNYVPTAMYPNAVRAAFAFAGNDVFVVGDTGIVHYGN